ncbi:MAG TPA: AmmeMemoRadiSam system protein B, partial [Spirochaeta sp.]|nr:AmmeMemoRadiSam system protein B [Spirochaeta sp.]
MLRKSILKGSWYPDREADISSELERWSGDITADSGLLSAVVPHAGWYYSGRTAAEALKSLCPGKEVLAVIGGHLPPGSSIIAAPEEQIETPLGSLNNRLDLIRRLSGELVIGDDIFSDNTVEVILPMIKAFSPEAEIMWLRAPADEKSITLGEKLYELAESEQIDLSVIGSTDLTHYGSNYDFYPEGPGADGLDWVKNVNDAGIINLLTDYRLE